MATKIRPLHDRVIVKRLEEEEKSKGGIIIPDTAKEKPQEGRVIAVGSGKPIANHVVRIVGVFLEVVPQSLAKRLSIRCEERRPGIRLPLNRVGDHHAGQRAECHAVAREPGGGVLMIGHHSDVRQAIMRLDHLP